jgi:hypothetical protein
MNTTVVNYAHTVARMAGVDVVSLAGLDVMDLDVLYYGILSGGAPVPFRSAVRYMETPSLELYRYDPIHDDACRAFCDLELARRANAARYAA